VFFGAVARLAKVVPYCRDEIAEDIGAIGCAIAEYSNAA